MGNGAIKDSFPIASEALEPTAAHIIGRMWARCEFAKTHDGGYGYEDALCSMWLAMDSLSKLSICIGTATHFSVAIMNHQRDFARLIEAEIGVDVYDDKQNGMWKWRR